MCRFCDSADAADSALCVVMVRTTIRAIQDRPRQFGKINRKNANGPIVRAIQSR